jgi:hypothetical protein
VDSRAKESVAPQRHIGSRHLPAVSNCVADPPAPDVIDVVGSAHAHPT